MSDARLQFTVCKSRWQHGDPGAIIDVALSDKPLKSTHNTIVWQAQQGEDAIFFKVYRHRPPRPFANYLPYRCRAEREFDRLCILADAHVPCSLPLVYGAGSNAEHGRFEIIGTREIPFAHQFRTHLLDLDRLGQTISLDMLFEVIYLQHKAGVYHGSLNPNNIVVSLPPDGEPSFHIVDLPRAIDFPYDITNTRMAWYDLVHFVFRTAPEAGKENCLGILDVYGFDEAKKQQFLEFLEAYRPSKRLRYRLKNEFGLKAWWAKRRENA